MEEAAAQGEWQSRKIKNWLLTLLRFAVTRDDTDKMCVLELAREIDRRNIASGETTFSFFVRTSSEICSTIVAGDCPDRQAMLARHFNRIEDLRLRAALEAATQNRADRSVLLSQTHELASSKLAKRKRDDLWRGLS